MIIRPKYLDVPYQKNTKYVAGAEAEHIRQYAIELEKELRSRIKQAIEMTYLTYATSDPSAPPVSDTDLANEQEHIDILVQRALSE